MIDVFNTGKDTYVGRLGHFVGATMEDGKVDNDTSGPDGVVAVGNEIWAGDGDSTVKVIDAATGTTTATLSSGRTTRVDEMASFRKIRPSSPSTTPRIRRSPP